MELKERAIQGEYYWPEELPAKDKCLFIDIETTGLSSKKAAIYMIGMLVWREDKWYLLQYFAERLLDEQKLLEEARRMINSHDTIITFNGNTFDLPFISSALKQYGMEGLEYENTFDLFRKLTPFKNILGMNSLKQVCFEERIGLDRVSDMNGGELIKVYEDYLKDRDEQKKAKLYYHNGSDVENMLKILEIFKINAFKFCKYELISSSIYQDYMELKLKAELRLGFKLEYENENTVIAIDDDMICVRLPVSENRAKLYYENFKDYYYLPIEDRAIHKSLAVFVENSVKEKAKRHTAYSWELVENCIKGLDRFISGVLIYHLKM